MTSVSQRRSIPILFVLSGFLLGSCSINIQIGRSSTPETKPEEPTRESARSTATPPAPAAKPEASTDTQSNYSLSPTFFLDGRAGSTTHLDGGLRRNRDSDQVFDVAAGVDLPDLEIGGLTQWSLWVGTDHAGVTKEGKTPAMVGVHFVVLESEVKETKTYFSSLQDWKFVGDYGYSESRYLVANGDFFYSLLHLSAGRDTDAWHYGVGLGSFCSAIAFNKPIHYSVFLDRNTCLLGQGSETVGTHVSMASDWMLRRYLSLGFDIDYQRHAIDLNEVRREHTWTGGLRMGFRF